MTNAQGNNTFKKLAQENKKALNIFTFQKVGDTLTGRITDITEHTFPNGDVRGKLFVEDTDRVIWEYTVSQVDVINWLAGIDTLDVGDYVSIKLTGLIDIPSKNWEKKEFEKKYKQGEPEEAPF